MVYEVLIVLGDPRLERGQFRVPSGLDFSGPHGITPQHIAYALIREHLADYPRDILMIRVAQRLFSLGCSGAGVASFPAPLLAMMQGDWGFSFVSRMNVDTLILQRLPVTLFVIGSSQVLALLIAIPVGVYAATRPYSIFDQIANTFAFIGFSLPTFFTGLLFILVFSIYLDWLPFVYRADISATGWRCGRAACSGRQSPRPSTCSPTTTK